MIPSKSCGVLLAACMTLAGCQRAEEITNYTVPRAETIQLGAIKTPAREPSRPERMLGLIVPGKEQLWFFKLTGPVEAVSGRLAEFREFASSLKVSEGTPPAWTLPVGWKQQDGSEMRFATIIVGDEQPPLEMSVIALPNTGDELSGQILSNVNRWRGQLSLESLTAEQLPKATETVTLADGAAITLVDLTGIKQGGMTPPFAGGTGSLRPGIMPPPTAAQPTVSALKYDVPSNWTVGTVTGLRKAAFEVKGDGEKVEITVIDLTRDAGDRLSNINRWRGQLGLAELTPAELPQAMQSISVGSLKGEYVELTGMAVGRPQSILGVIVDQGEQTWFIKLQGDKALAERETKSFRAFAESIRFE